MQLTIQPVLPFGFRSLLVLLLSALALGGCSLLHPHRIPSPKVPAEFKAQQKAARKAQKNGAKAAKNAAKVSRKNQDQETDDSAGAAPGAAPADATTEGQGTASLPNKSTVKYDKKSGLMKKPNMKRLRDYKYQTARKPFRPFGFLSTLFHQKPKRHDQDQPSPARNAAPPAAPAPADTGLTP